MLPLAQLWCGKPRSSDRTYMRCRSGSRAPCPRGVCRFGPVMNGTVGPGASRRGGDNGAMEGWVSTARGRHLAGRSKRDTKPEMLLRSAVHALGLRYAVQKTLARGCTPDITLVRHRLAVFVDGCFCVDLAPLREAVH